MGEPVATSQRLGVAAGLRAASPDQSRSVIGRELRLGIIAAIQLRCCELARRLPRRRTRVDPGLRGRHEFWGDEE